MKTTETTKLNNWLKETGAELLESKINTCEFGQEFEATLNWNGKRTLICQLTKTGNFKKNSALVFDENNKVRLHGFSII